MFKALIKILPNSKIPYVFPCFSSKLIQINGLSRTELVQFSTTNWSHSSETTNSTKVSPKAKVKVCFVKYDGQRLEAVGKEGDNLLDVVVNNNLDIDGFGACEGTLACSTCHLIFSKSDYDRLPEKPTDEELDMLDLAYELTDTSRLGCQVYLTKQLEGLEVKVPAGVNDVRST